MNYVHFRLYLKVGPGWKTAEILQELTEDICCNVAAQKVFKKHKLSSSYGRGNVSVEQFFFLIFYFISPSFSNLKGVKV